MNSQEKKRDFFLKVLMTQTQKTIRIGIYHAKNFHKR
jgi:hypothetical protein